MTDWDDAAVGSGDVAGLDHDRAASVLPTLALLLGGPHR